LEGDFADKRASPDKSYVIKGFLSIKKYSSIVQKEVSEKTKIE